jgi:hypothetical protein
MLSGTSGLRCSPFGSFPWLELDLAPSCYADSCDLMRSTDHGCRLPEMHPLRNGICASVGAVHWRVNLN